MKRDTPPELEMTLNGEFVSPPRAPVSSRIMLWAIIIAVIAGGLSLAALALWLALLILPVAVGAAVIAWALFRYRMWRAGLSSNGQSAGGQPAGGHPFGGPPPAGPLFGRQRDVWNSRGRP